MKRHFMPWKIAGGGAPFVGDLVNQDFAASGYSNSEGFWYPGSGTNPNFSTTGLGLPGAYCCKLDSSSSTTELNAYQAFALRDELFTYWKFRFDRLPDTIADVLIYRNGFDAQGKIMLLGDGRLYVQALGGTAVPLVGTMAPNTVYDIWSYRKKSTGADDGTVKVAFSTNGIRPTSGNNYGESTDGNGTTQTDSLWFTYTKDSTPGGIAYLSRIRANTTQVPNNP